MQCQLVKLVLVPQVVNRSVYAYSRWLPPRELAPESGQVEPTSLVLRFGYTCYSRVRNNRVRSSTGCFRLWQMCRPLPCFRTFCLLHCPEWSPY